MTTVDPNASASSSSSKRRRGKLCQAQEAFAELLQQASERGFYGVTSLTIHVQDGHFQQVRVSFDRILK